VITQYMIEDAISGEISTQAELKDEALLKEIRASAQGQIQEALEARDDANENLANAEEELEAAKECLETVAFALRNTPEKELTADLIELLDVFKREWQLI
jgi:seryl-tRNA synthetase